MPHWRAVPIKFFNNVHVSAALDSFGLSNLIVLFLKCQNLKKTQTDASSTFWWTANFQGPMWWMYCHLVMRMRIKTKLTPLSTFTFAAATKNTIHQFLGYCWNMIVPTNNKAMIHSFRWLMKSWLQMFECISDAKPAYCTYKNEVCRIFLFYSKILRFCNVPIQRRQYHSKQFFSSPLYIWFSGITHCRGFFRTVSSLLQRDFTEVNCTQST